MDLGRLKAFFGPAQHPRAQREKTTETLQEKKGVDLDGLICQGVTSCHLELRLAVNRSTCLRPRIASRCVCALSVRCIVEEMEIAKRLAAPPKIRRN